MDCNSIRIAMATSLLRAILSVALFYYIALTLYVFVLKRLKAKTKTLAQRTALNVLYYIVVGIVAFVVFVVFSY